jgi:hypothetical protein
LTEVIADLEDRELANTVKALTEVTVDLEVPQPVICVESVTEVLLGDPVPAKKRRTPEGFEKQTQVILGGYDVIKL